MKVELSSASVVNHFDVLMIASDHDPSYVSNTYVESQSLTMRLGRCRSTHLTNEFGKKVEFHAHALSLNFLHCSFDRPHESLRVKNNNGDASRWHLGENLWYFMPHLISSTTRRESRSFRAGRGSR